MSNIRLIGLESIKIGSVMASGLMATGASIATISPTVPDSAHLIVEAPASTDLFVEETDLPDISILGTSKKTIEFATRDIGFDALIEAFSRASASSVWSAPVTALVIRE